MLTSKNHLTPGFDFLIFNLKIVFLAASLTLVSCNMKSVKTYVFEADQLVQSQKTEEAIILYQKAIQALPKESVLYLNQAALLRKTQKYPQAIRNYEVVKKLNPESFWSYMGLSRIYTLQKEFDKAKDVLKEGLEQIPSNGTLLFHLGRVYYQAGNGELAVKYLNQAFDAKYVNLHKIYYFRGLTFEKLLHNVERAKLDYKSYMMMDRADRKEEVQKMLNNIDDGRYDF